MNSQTGDGPPKAVLIVAVVVAVGAVVAVLAVAAVRQRQPAPEPIAISTVPAPRAESPECGALIGALPDQLGDYQRAPVVEPTPPGTAAWQSDAGAEALILRCGLDRPAEFVVGAPLQMVDAVQWFRVGETAAGAPGAGETGAGGPATGETAAGEGAAGRSTWFAVDRPVYVALTLPAGSGPTPIQRLSAAIAETLPEQPIDPAPAR
ncbi:DUF3515 domain-containing protein [Mycolicibacterium poriferae]|uniref:Membrane protein n=1 Tax=Mycolicibacterium poriferae TaxID=39694 RepID=A0A6N4V6Y5_9MYCO|nr:DUF3515 domain-containing protein [Mycolicibacterium poriferae]MCV7265388.1 DUF3515 domain-containing protein [Mycolicibacterium poriferae]BBX51452.1 membrane protein [Mycolicibacterium poriferae]